MTRAELFRRFPRPWRVELVDAGPDSASLVDADASFIAELKFCSIPKAIAALIVDLVNAAEES